MKRSTACYVSSAIPGACETDQETLTLLSEIWAWMPSITVVWAWTRHSARLSSCFLICEHKGIFQAPKSLPGSLKLMLNKYLLLSALPSLNSVLASSSVPGVRLDACLTLMETVLFSAACAWLPGSLTGPVKAWVFCSGCGSVAESQSRSKDKHRLLTPDFAVYSPEGAHLRGLPQPCFLFCLHFHSSWCQLRVRGGQSPHSLPELWGPGIAWSSSRFP